MPAARRKPLTPPAHAARRKTGRPSRPRLIAVAALGLMLCAAWGAVAGAELAKAVKNADAKTIARLLAHETGVNEPDKQGRTPLYWACSRADALLIDQLLAHGADANSRDGEGDTPLMALVRSTADVRGPAAALIAHGAYLNLQNSTGGTALMEAIDHAPQALDLRASAALVKALLDAGADPTLKDWSGATAVHHAAAAGEPMAMVLTVLAATHNPNVRTGEGLDLLMISVRHDRGPLTQHLFDLGLSPIPIGSRPSADLTVADDHQRLNARAFDVWADWLDAHDRAADARSARLRAVGYYQRAIAEDERAIGQLYSLIGEDKRDTNAMRAAVVVGTAAGVALAAQTGSGYILLMRPGAGLGADKLRLKVLQAEVAAMSARRAQLTGAAPSALPEAAARP